MITKRPFNYYKSIDKHMASHLYVEPNANHHIQETNHLKFNWPYSSQDDNKKRLLQFFMALNCSSIHVHQMDSISTLIKSIDFLNGSKRHLISLCGFDRKQDIQKIIRIKVIDSAHDTFYWYSHALCFYYICQLKFIAFDGSHFLGGGEW